MGRPLENGIPWFRHSTVQLHNPKIQVLVQMYGMAGPGVYNGLLEQIHRQAGKPYVLSGAQLRYLSRLMGTSTKKLTEMAQSCVEVGLFSRQCWDNDRTLSTFEIEKEIKSVLDIREEKRRNRERTNPPTNCPTKNELCHPREEEAEVDTETEEEGEATNPLPPSGLVAPADSLELIKDNIHLRNGELIEAELAAAKYPVKMVRAAVGEACANNVLKWNYVVTILERWERALNRGGAA